MHFCILCDDAFRVNRRANKWKVIFLSYMIVNVVLIILARRIEFLAGFSSSSESVILRNFTHKIPQKKWKKFCVVIYIFVFNFVTQHLTKIEFIASSINQHLFLFAVCKCCCFVARMASSPQQQRLMDPLGFPNASQSQLPHHTGQTH